MQVFTDESGDAGFKLDEGSSKFFVIACVIFDDPLEAETTALAIKKLRRSLKVSDDYEFHFNGTKQAFKEAFFNETANSKFRVRAIVIDKSLITSSTLRLNKAKFYNYALKMLLQNSRGTIVNASIKLDGRGDRLYKREAASYFRAQLNSRDSKIIKKLKFVDSKENVLIQLADMVAGAIARSEYTNKKDHLLYRKLISKRIQNIWHFK